MNMVMYLLDNPFETMTKPIIELINSALNPIIALVVAIGAIYCVFLGAKLAKAEEPQEREKSKQHLKNAIIGFLLIFILIVALKVGVGPLQDWIASSTKNTNKKSTETTTKSAMVTEDAYENTILDNIYTI